MSRGALIFVTAFSRTFRQPQIIKAHDWQTEIKVSTRSHSFLLSLCDVSCRFNVYEPFSIARLTHETKCFACMDAVIRLIPFEPRMDVPDIWKAKNRVAVILISIIVSIASCFLVRKGCLSPSLRGSYSQW